MSDYDRAKKNQCDNDICFYNVKYIFKCRVYFDFSMESQ